MLQSPRSQPGLLWPFRKKEIFAQLYLLRKYSQWPIYRTSLGVCHQRKEFGKYSIYARCNFYLAINEIMSFIGKWVELENITSSKKSQTQNDEFFMLSLVCPPYVFLKK